MRCPYCHIGDSRVIDSRDTPVGDAIRRRRECVNCTRRFTTYERIEPATLIVVKKDGRRQEYSPEKLRQKLRVALTKRPVGEDEIDALLQRVETALLEWGTKEVPSSMIGEAVLRELQALDEVAYIRFASVYRQFGDLDDLRREVEELRATTADLQRIGSLPASPPGGAKRSHPRRQRTTSKRPSSSSPEQ